MQLWPPLSSNITPLQSPSIPTTLLPSLPVLVSTSTMSSSKPSHSPPPSSAPTPTTTNRPNKPHLLPPHPRSATWPKPKPSMPRSSTSASSRPRATATCPASSPRPGRAASSSASCTSTPGSSTGTATSRLRCCTTTRCTIFILCWRGSLLMGEGCWGGGVGMRTGLRCSWRSLSLMGWCMG